jgi:hypothetical protein
MIQRCQRPLYPRVTELPSCVTTAVSAAAEGSKIKDDDIYSDDEPDYSETFGLPVELPSTFRRLGTRASSRSSTGRSVLDGDGGETTARSKDTIVVSRLPRTQRLLARTAIPTSPIRPESGLSTARSMRSSASLSESIGSPSSKATKPNVWHKVHIFVDDLGAKRVHRNPTCHRVAGSPQ